MAYTETQSVSWFDRLGSSFRGILAGILLVVAGTVVLWWNEGNFVATNDALGEAQSVTQELGNITTLDSAKSGQLVHAEGPAATKDILSDPVFGLSVNAIRLERAVEFYQWVEEARSERRQKLGGGEEIVTTYTYSQGWTNRPVDSSQFKDPKARTENANIVLVNLDNLVVQAGNVTFGAYRLPDFLVGSIRGGVPLNAVLSDETKAALNKQLAQTAQKAGSAEMVHASGNTVYLGASPLSPHVGDARATFLQTPPGTVSILAKLSGDTFERYRADNGKAFSMLTMGTRGMDDMYGDAHAANTAMTWMLRLVGAFLVVFGLRMIIAPLSVVAGVIPLLGNIVGAGAGFVSIVLGLAWALVVISIAWLRYRPLIGVCALVVAGALIVLLHGRGRSRKAANT